MTGFVLALTEAASNVIKHAPGGTESQPIWISLDLRARGLEARICHLDAPFDGQAPRPRPLTAHARAGSACT